MRIDEHMDLSALMERMGTDATKFDAILMGAALLRTHEGEDTADIEPDEWQTLLGIVASSAPTQD